MFFTKKRENELIDSLASISCIQRSATPDQFSTIISTFNSRKLNIINRFLAKQTEFGLRGRTEKDSSPSGDSTDKGS